MARLRRYVPDSDKTGYYLRDSINDRSIIYQISGGCEEILTSFGYEDKDKIPEEILGILYNLDLIYTNNSVRSRSKEVDNVSSMDSTVEDLSDEDRRDFFCLIVDNCNLNSEAYNELEQYTDKHDIDIENIDGENINIENTAGSDAPFSVQDREQDPANHPDVASDEQTTTPASSVSKEEPADEHVESRLLCEFCETKHDATKLLEHVMYSDDESHSSLGTVPEGFHPTTAPVIEDGTIQVAFPAKLRTNVNFHPVCRWCGKKFHIVEDYLDHMNGLESFDESCHQANKQQNQPLLVPFHRDGTVIPTVPPLAELTEDTTLENIPDRNTVAESDHQTDLTGLDSGADQPALGVLNEEDTNTSTTDTGAERSSRKIVETNPLSGKKENETGSSVDAVEINPETEIANGFREDGDSIKAITMTTEISDEKTVEIDGALLALADLMVEDETTEHTSRVDLLDTALDEFLGSIITGDQTGSERQITTDRHFDIETDPALRYLLQKKVENEDEFDSSTEFIQHALFEALGIDSTTGTITIPNYNRYEFVIERLVKNNDYPYDSPSQTVHAALESHLQI